MFLSSEAITLLMYVRVVFFHSEEISNEYLCFAVIIVPFAGLDMWGMMHSISKGEFIKKTIKTLELYLDTAMEQGRKHGIEASQVVVIMDMENFNLRQYAWRPGKLICYQKIYY